MKTGLNPELEAFSRLVEKLIAVPRSLILERENVYRQKSLQNPRRRGPKPRTRPPKSVRTGPQTHADQD